MTMNSRTDEDLLAAFVAGDDEALGTLAGRHEAALLGLARGLLGGQDSLARDAVQEAWVRVIRFGHQFNGSSRFRTWVYRITINQCRDLQRRVVRERAAGNPTLPLAVRRNASKCADVETTQDECGRELRGELRGAVDELPVRHREIVLLCYHRGMTHEQAAAILQLPLGTLKSRLNAALNRLRERLGSEVTV